MRNRFRSRNPVRGSALEVRWRRRRAASRPRSIRVSRTSALARWRQQRRIQRRPRLNRSSTAFTRWVQRRRSERGPRIERQSAYARWRARRLAERGPRISPPSRLEARLAARRQHKPPSMKVERTSALTRKLRELRARRGFVTERQGPIGRWAAKRRSQRGYVEATLSTGARAGLAFVVLIAGGVYAYARYDAARNMERAAEVARAASRNTTTTTTTTTTMPTTTTLPPDDPEVCRARDVVLVAAALDLEASREQIVTQLTTMADALEILVEVDRHPDLAEAARTVRPVIDDAVAAIEANPSADIVALAARPEFTDPDVLNAVGYVATYPLQCPA